MVTDSKDSILAMIAGALSPVFAPLGFGDWRISTALVTGFMAKESVVSTLTVLFGTTEALLGTITAAGAAALLVFLPVVYSLCGCGCIDQAGAWRKMGVFCCHRPMCDRMACGIRSSYSCDAFLNLLGPGRGNGT